MPGDDDLAFDETCIPRTLTNDELTLAVGFVCENGAIIPPVIRRTLLLSVAIARVLNTISPGLLRFCLDTAVCVAQRVGPLTDEQLTGLRARYRAAMERITV